VGLLAYYGGKAVADTVTQYGLYAGIAIAVAIILVVTVLKVVERRRSEA
jgi:membrane protein DedA with SNARE-associated domain